MYSDQAAAVDSVTGMMKAGAEGLFSATGGFDLSQATAPNMKADDSRAARSARVLLKAGEIIHSKDARAARRATPYGYFLSGPCQRMSEIIHFPSYLPSSR